MAMISLQFADVNGEDMCRADPHLALLRVPKQHYRIEAVVPPTDLLHVLQSMTVQ